MDRRCSILPVWTSALPLLQYTLSPVGRTRSMYPLGGRYNKSVSSSWTTQTLGSLDYCLGQRMTVTDGLVCAVSQDIFELSRYFRCLRSRRLRRELLALDSLSSMILVEADGK